MTSDASPGRDPECQVCPVCALLRVVRGTQPEVVEHLAAAARELTLALRATLEAQADGHDHADGGRKGGERGEPTDRLQRIRID